MLLNLSIHVSESTINLSFIRNVRRLQIIQNRTIFINVIPVTFLCALNTSKHLQLHSCHLLKLRNALATLTIHLLLHKQVATSLIRCLLLVCVDQSLQLHILPS